MNKKKLRAVHTQEEKLHNVNWIHTLEYCTETLRLRNNEMTLARRWEFATM